MTGEAYGSTCSAQSTQEIWLGHCFFFFFFFFFFKRREKLSNFGILKLFSRRVWSRSAVAFSSGASPGGGHRGHRVRGGPRPSSALLCGASLKMALHQQPNKQQATTKHKSQATTKKKKKKTTTNKQREEAGAASLRLSKEDMSSAFAASGSKLPRSGPCCFGQKPHGPKIGADGWCTLS